MKNTDGSVVVMIFESCRRVSAGSTARDFRQNYAGCERAWDFASASLVMIDSTHQCRNRTESICDSASSPITLNMNAASVVDQAAMIATVWAFLEQPPSASTTP